MILSVGTSGFCYKEWRGHFYPEKMPERDMLGYYAARFPTVEINNTFYRMPSPKVLAEWTQHVPAGFAFTLKAPRRITHEKRLVDCADHLGALCERSEALGAHMGALLFQLPPFLRKDVARLAAFLDLVPRGRDVAFEFRHASWHDADVHALLAERGAMLCVTDSEVGETPFVVTARNAYVRLRRTHYDEAELRGWAGRVAAGGAERTFVYFMHEDEALGTKFAQSLIAHWSELVPPSAAPYAA